MLFFAKHEKFLFFLWEKEDNISQKKLDFNLIWKKEFENDSFLHGTYVSDLHVKVSQVGKVENCWF